MFELKKENNEYENQKKESFLKKAKSDSKLFFKNTLKNIIKFKNDDFFKNHIILWLLVFNFLANLINWVILAIFINKNVRSIILHYNVYFGVDRTGGWGESFIMPAVGIIIFLINFYLAFFFYKNKERIASYVILLASLMVQLSLIIGSISVILINY